MSFIFQMGRNILLISCIGPKCRPVSADIPSNQKTGYTVVLLTTIHNNSVL